jgi:hypothetical protein
LDVDDINIDLDKKTNESRHRWVDLDNTDDPDGKLYEYLLLLLLMLMMMFLNCNTLVGV